jgi:hypothetical protein
VKGNPEDKLFVRGQGANLSWDKGVAMKFSQGKWTFETEAEFEKIEYKLLKNDIIWEQGENHISLFNSEAELSPRF